MPEESAAKIATSLPLAQNSWEHYINAFSSRLFAQGYATGSIRSKMTVVRQFSEWLVSKYPATQEDYLDLFFKDYPRPGHASTIAQLETYSHVRDQVLSKTTSSSFFVSERGTRLTHWTVRHTFVKLSHKIGLRGPNDTHGPRLHDLRHTFAVKTLLQWYRAGDNIECRMPELATYLGHAHVKDTYWYLSAVPELLHEAVMCLDAAPGGIWP